MHAQKGTKRKYSQKVVERVKRLNPIDDSFFVKMAEDLGACEEMARVFLNDADLIVKEAVAQKVLKNLQGRSVILDMYCVLGSGKYVNVEVQKSNNDNHVKRVRYNASCLTTNITDTGEKFEKVPDIYMIYITKTDFLKGDKTVYHVDRIIRETGELVDNGVAEIYINAEIKEDTDISEMMTIFTENDVYNHDKFPKVSKRKYYFKESEEGVEEMCEVMEEFWQEGRQEGRQEGIINLAVIWLADGTVSMEKAMEQTGLSEEELLKAVEEYRKNNA